MNKLNNGPTQQLDTALEDWGRLQNETQSFLSTMKSYYSEYQDFSTQFEEATNRNKRVLQEYENRHYKVTAEAKTAKDRLQVQVRSSGNQAERMKRHGPKVVFIVALICGGIGAGIGSRMGWVLALVGALVGFFGLGGAAVILFLFMRWKYVRRHTKWLTAQRNNREALERVPFMEAKTQKVSAILGSMNDIEERTMGSVIPDLLRKIDKYLANK